MDPSVVHIFWDHSNLFIRAQDACDSKDGGGIEPGHRLDARLNFKNVLEFAAAGRTIERAVAVGSVPPGLAALWERLKQAGVEIDLQERGAESGKEQAVDEVIKLAMLESVVDREVPAVAVLLSGDGGFRPTIDRLLRKGWGVEVLAFEKGFSHKLRSIATGSGGRGKYIKMDPWYRQLIYLQGLGEEILRPADPLDLKGRPKI